VKPLTYLEAVRSFDHAPLAASPAYAALRQALSDLANESADLDPAITLAGYLDAVRDMAATAPYGDMCNRCCLACARTHQHGDDEFPRPCDAYRTWWPHAAVRAGGGVTGTYRCGTGHEWTCWWSVDAAYLEIT
jgi:hypothetical protein